MEANMRVELFGMARALVGKPQAYLALREPVRLVDMLQALAEQNPNLIGTVLDGQYNLIEPNVVLLDGRRAVDPLDAISAADKPCIVLLPSGG
jgi:hypothetical protein